MSTSTIFSILGISLAFLAIVIAVMWCVTKVIAEITGCEEDADASDASKKNLAAPTRP